MGAIVKSSDYREAESEISSAEPESAAAVTAATNEPAGGAPRVGVAIGVLTVIALVAALYLARAFFVPLIIGILAFMTWLQSRVAGLNAAVLFIALLFFGWLWGIWGLLLGAPLVAIAKMICDRVESLKPASELLGR